MRLIDADALKETICDNVYPVTDYFNSRDYGMFWTGGIEKAINEAPTIDAEPIRHGKWIWEECVYKCSECSHKAYGNILECMDGTYKYCPYCGARMDGE